MPDGAKFRGLASAVFALVKVVSLEREQAQRAWQSEVSIMLGEVELNLTRAYTALNDVAELP